MKRVAVEIAGEVTIHVTRQERQAREEAQAHYERTDVRLHRVRSFLRQQNNKIVRVRERWRGDASKGHIERTGYKVKL